MEELLGFSFEHIDKLAARRGKTVTMEEKERLWDYVERMRSEQDEWVTKDSVSWDEVDARYALRTKSISLSSLPTELVLSGSGAQTPPPLLYSSRKLHPRQQPQASGGASGREALCELQAGESLTQSEVWDVGSPRRRNIAAMKQASAQKKHGWQRMLRKVFHNSPKQGAASDCLVDFDEFFTGVAMSSSPCEGEKDEWITKESLPWDEINERYALRSKSLSRMSIPNLFLPEEPAPGKETKKQALCELQAGESLTQSEVWDVGSPRGHDIPAMKKASAKKEHGWKRALKNVLKDDAKKEAGILRLGGLDEFATGITMTSSPLPVPRALTADGPPPPPAATFDEERPAGLIRQSLSSFGMHSGKKDAAGPTKADNV
ncbi:hypothetical protein V5799_012985 [Amblyomma americanum]|uniref:Uncharacterized protein n=1 Tax=Amblyomma americanum TaxID=6943 RepID=A0AAQ4E7A6_AMBAM